MKTTLHIKVDEAVKNRAQLLARRLGLPLSLVINASLRNFIKTQTFSVSAGETMTPYMESWLAEIECDKKTGKHVNGPFSSIAALRKHLSR